MITKGAETKKRVIDKSLHLFSLKGYYNTSINDILEATGLTKGGLYGHFKSKEAIWYESYDQAVDIWKNIVFTDIQETDDPLEKIKQALDKDLGTYLGENVFQGGCFFLNMLVELSGQSKSMSDHVLKGMFGFSELIEQCLLEAHEQDMLKPGLDLNEIAQFIIVSINGCAAIYAATRDSETWKLTLRQIYFYIDGLKK